MHSEGTSAEGHIDDFWAIKRQNFSQDLLVANTLVRPTRNQPGTEGFDFSGSTAWLLPNNGQPGSYRSSVGSVPTNAHEGSTTVLPKTDRSQARFRLIIDL
jgi:hypothetical protein